ncbi:hypothetical protein [Nocardioides nitrophenolicus]|uniref:hypothetical protein n=1 Tax=Nocardioides nitrophenolicus TaxID=60489 RepID=UPI00195BA0FD|nr:hypothetical protein [Nocardioides nitrophenolicus]MBM7519164.1 hypothetical protein [Nocardioides nitrophenolicus]
MRSTSNRRTPLRALSVLAATVAATAIGVSAPAAHASDTSDADNVTLSPASSSYTDTQTVTVTQSGLAASTEYTVSVCEYTTYSFLLLAKIPACGATSQVDTTTSASGVLTVTGFQLLAQDDNAHDFLFGQPARIDCAAKLCEVVITPTHSGSSGSYAGDSAEFNVS